MPCFLNMMKWRITKRRVNPGNTNVWREYNLDNVEVPNVDPPLNDFTKVVPIPLYISSRDSGTAVTILDAQ